MFFPIASRMMQALDRKVFGDSDYHKDPRFHDAALRALVALGHPGTFEFLLERCVDADVNPAWQHLSMAAIETLRDMATRHSSDGGLASPRGPRYTPARPRRSRHDQHEAST